MEPLPAGRSSELKDQGVAVRSCTVSEFPNGLPAAAEDRRLSSVPSVHTPWGNNRSSRGLLETAAYDGSAGCSPNGGYNANYSPHTRHSPNGSPKRSIPEEICAYGLVREAFSTSPQLGNLAGKLSREVNDLFQHSPKRNSNLRMDYSIGPPIGNPGGYKRVKDVSSYTNARAGSAGKMSPFDDLPSPLPPLPPSAQRVRERAAAKVDTSSPPLSVKHARGNTSVRGSISVRGRTTSSQGRRRSGSHRQLLEVEQEAAERSRLVEEARIKEQDRRQSIAEEKERELLQRKSEIDEKFSQLQETLPDLSNVDDKYDELLENIPYYRSSHVGESLYSSKSAKSPSHGRNSPSGASGRKKRKSSLRNSNASLKASEKGVPGSLRDNAARQSTAIRESGAMNVARRESAAMYSIRESAFRDSAVRMTVGSPDTEIDNPAKAPEILVKSSVRGAKPSGPKRGGATQSLSGAQASGALALGASTQPPGGTTQASTGRISAAIGTFEGTSLQERAFTDKALSRRDTHDRQQGKGNLSTDRVESQANSSLTMPDLFSRFDEAAKSLNRNLMQDIHAFDKKKGLHHEVHVRGGSIVATKKDESSASKKDSIASDADNKNKDRAYSTWRNEPGSRNESGSREEPGSQLPKSSMHTSDNSPTTKAKERRSAVSELMSDVIRGSLTGFNPGGNDNDPEGGGKDNVSVDDNRDSEIDISSLGPHLDPMPLASRMSEDCRDSEAIFDNFAMLSETSLAASHTGMGVKVSVNNLDQQQSGLLQLHGCLSQPQGGLVQQSSDLLQQQRSTINVSIAGQLNPSGHLIWNESAAISPWKSANSELIFDNYAPLSQTASANASANVNMSANGEAPSDANIVPGNSSVRIAHQKSDATILFGKNASIGGHRHLRPEQEFLADGIFHRMTRVLISEIMDMGKVSMRNKIRDSEASSRKSIIMGRNLVIADGSGLIRNSDSAMGNAKAGGDIEIVPEDVVHDGGIPSQNHGTGIDLNEDVVSDIRAIGVDLKEHLRHTDNSSTKASMIRNVSVMGNVMQAAGLYDEVIRYLKIIATQLATAAIAADTVQNNRAKGAAVENDKSGSSPFASEFDKSANKIGEDSDQVRSGIEESVKSIVHRIEEADLPSEIRKKLVSVAEHTLRPILTSLDSLRQKHENTREASPQPGAKLLFNRRAPSVTFDENVAMNKIKTVGFQCGSQNNDSGLDVGVISALRAIGTSPFDHGYQQGLQQGRYQGYHEQQQCASQHSNYLQHASQDAEHPPILHNAEHPPPELDVDFNLTRDQSTQSYPESCHLGAAPGVPPLSGGWVSVPGVRFRSSVSVDSSISKAPKSDGMPAGGLLASGIPKSDFLDAVAFNKFQKEALEEGNGLHWQPQTMLPVSTMPSGVSTLPSQHHGHAPHSTMHPMSHSFIQSTNRSGVHGMPSGWQPVSDAGTLISDASHGNPVSSLNFVGESRLKTMIADPSLFSGLSGGESDQGGDSQPGSQILSGKGTTCTFASEGTDSQFAQLADSQSKTESQFANFPARNSRVSEEFAESCRLVTEQNAWKSAGLGAAAPQPSHGVATFSEFTDRTVPGPPGYAKPPSPPLPHVQNFQNFVEQTTSHVPSPSLSKTPYLDRRRIGDAHSDVESIEKEIYSIRNLVDNVEAATEAGKGIKIPPYVSQNARESLSNGGKQDKSPYAASFAHSDPRQESSHPHGVHYGVTAHQDTANFSSSSRPNHGVPYIEAGIPMISQIHSHWSAVTHARASLRGSTRESHVVYQSQKVPVTGGEAPDHDRSPAITPASGQVQRHYDGHVHQSDVRMTRIAETTTGGQITQGIPETLEEVEQKLAETKAVMAKIEEIVAQSGVQGSQRAFLQGEEAGHGRPEAQGEGLQGQQAIHDVLHAYRERMNELDSLLMVTDIVSPGTLGLATGSPGAAAESPSASKISAGGVVSAPAEKISAVNLPVSNVLGSQFQKSQSPAATDRNSQFSAIDKILGDAPGLGVMDTNTDMVSGAAVKRARSAGANILNENDIEEAKMQPGSGISDSSNAMLIFHGIPSDVKRTSLSTYVNPNLSSDVRQVDQLSSDVRQDLTNVQMRQGVNNLEMRDFIVQPGDVSTQSVAHGGQQEAKDESQQAASMASKAANIASRAVMMAQQYLSLSPKTFPSQTPCNINQESVNQDDFNQTNFNQTNVGFITTHTNVQARSTNVQTDTDFVDDYFARIGPAEGSPVHGGASSSGLSRSVPSQISASGLNKGENASGANDTGENLAVQIASANASAAFPEGISLNSVVAPRLVDVSSAFGAIPAGNILSRSFTIGQKLPQMGTLGRVNMPPPTIEGNFTIIKSAENVFRVDPMEPSSNGNFFPTVSLSPLSGRVRDIFQSALEFSSEMITNPLDQRGIFVNPSAAAIYTQNQSPQSNLLCEETHFSNVSRNRCGGSVASGVYYRSHPYQSPQANVSPSAQQPKSTTKLNTIFAGAVFESAGSITTGETPVQLEYERISPNSNAANPGVGQFPPAPTSNTLQQYAMSPTSERISDLQSQSSVVLDTTIFYARANVGKTPRGGILIACTYETGNQDASKGQFKCALFPMESRKLITLLSSSNSRIARVRAQVVQPDLNRIIQTEIVVRRMPTGWAQFITDKMNSDGQAFRVQGNVEAKDLIKILQMLGHHSKPPLPGEVEIDIDGRVFHVDPVSPKSTRGQAPATNIIPASENGGLAGSGPVGSSPNVISSRVSSPAGHSESPTLQQQPVPKETSLGMNSGSRSPEAQPLGGGSRGSALAHSRISLPSEDPYGFVSPAPPTEFSTSAFGSPDRQTVSRQRMMTLTGGAGSPSNNNVTSVVVALDDKTEVRIDATRMERNEGTPGPGGPGQITIRDAQRPNEAGQLPTGDGLPHANLSHSSALNLKISSGDGSGHKSGSPTRWKSPNVGSGSGRQSPSGDPDVNSVTKIINFSPEVINEHYFHPYTAMDKYQPPDVFGYQCGYFAAASSYKLDYPHKLPELMRKQRSSSCELFTRKKFFGKFTRTLQGEVNTGKIGPFNVSTSPVKRRLLNLEHMRTGTFSDSWQNYGQIPNPLIKTGPLRASTRLPVWNPAMNFSPHLSAAFTVSGRPPQISNGWKTDPNDKKSQYYATMLQKNCASPHRTRNDKNNDRLVMQKSASGLLSHVKPVLPTFAANSHLLGKTNFFTAEVSPARQRPEDVECSPVNLKSPTHIDYAIHRPDMVNNRLQKRVGSFQPTPLIAPGLTSVEKILFPRTKEADLDINVDNRGTGGGNRGGTLGDNQEFYSTANYHSARAFEQEGRASRNSGLVNMETFYSMGKYSPQSSHTGKQTSVSSSHGGEMFRPTADATQSDGRISVQKSSDAFFDSQIVNDVRKVASVAKNAINGLFFVNDTHVEEQQMQNDGQTEYESLEAGSGYGLVGTDGVGGIGGTVSIDSTDTISDAPPNGFESVGTPGSIALPAIGLATTPEDHNNLPKERTSNYENRISAAITNSSADDTRSIRNSNAFRSSKATLKSSVILLGGGSGDGRAGGVSDSRDGNPTNVDGRSQQSIQFTQVMASVNDGMSGEEDQDEHTTGAPGPVSMLGYEEDDSVPDEFVAMTMPHAPVGENAQPVDLTDQVSNAANNQYYQSPPTSNQGSNVSNDQFCQSSTQISNASVANASVRQFNNQSHQTSNASNCHPSLNQRGSSRGESGFFLASANAMENQSAYQTIDNSSLNQSAYQTASSGQAPGGISVSGGASVHDGVSDLPGVSAPGGTSVPGESTVWGSKQSQHSDGGTMTARDEDAGTEAIEEDALREIQEGNTIAKLVDISKESKDPPGAAPKSSGARSSSQNPKPSTEKDPSLQNSPKYFYSSSASSSASGYPASGQHKSALNAQNLLSTSTQDNLKSTDTPGRASGPAHATVSAGQSMMYSHRDSESYSEECDPDASSVPESAGANPVGSATPVAGMSFLSEKNRATFPIAHIGVGSSHTGAGGAHSEGRNTPPSNVPSHQRDGNHFAAGSSIGKELARLPFGSEERLPSWHWESDSTVGENGETKVNTNGARKVMMTLGLKGSSKLNYPESPLVSSVPTSRTSSHSVDVARPSSKTSDQVELSKQISHMSKESSRKLSHGIPPLPSSRSSSHHSGDQSRQSSKQLPPSGPPSAHASCSSSEQVTIALESSRNETKGVSLSVNSQNRTGNILRADESHSSSKTPGNQTIRLGKEHFGAEEIRLQNRRDTKQTRVGIHVHRGYSESRIDYAEHDSEQDTACTMRSPQKSQRPIEHVKKAMRSVFVDTLAESD